VTATDRSEELRRLLDDLAAMRLPPSGWAGVEAELRGVSPEEADSLERVSQVVFEARVQRRFHGGRSSTTLPPTKRTSALPWIGLVCGALLLAVGGTLGGGAVLAAVALLGLFVFGVALAGSRVTHGRARPAPDGTAPLVAVPASTAEVIDALRPPA
jgi:hypothetical protein